MDIETLLATLLGDHPSIVATLAMAVAAASILDALLPQPAPNSPWLPARKLLSAVAANVRHASNAGQPPLAGSLAKVARAVIAGQGVRPEPEAEPTHGEVICQIAAELNPADPVAYAAGMARIADVARKAVG
ncbi:hypothetical protein [Azospirillum cavernae]|nr:hypothetical protein [Azospirillum cavernae]